MTKSIIYKFQDNDLCIALNDKGALFENYSDPKLRLKKAKEFSFAEADISDLNYHSVEKIESFPGEDGRLVCQFLSFFWPDFPSEYLLGTLKTGIFKSYSQKEVILFGGTFHPWHSGHQACLTLCPQNERLVVVPDYNPFKTKIERSCDFEFYKNMCEITNCPVYPGFCGLTKPNPTYTWFSRIQYKNRSLLMGDDTFMGLPTWHNVEEVIKHLEFIYVAPRWDDKNKIDQVVDWLKREHKFYQVEFLEDHPFKHLSSTSIRSGKIQDQ